MTGKEKQLSSKKFVLLRTLIVHTAIQPTQPIKPVYLSYLDPGAAARLRAPDAGKQKCASRAGVLVGGCSDWLLALTAPPLIAGREARPLSLLLRDHS